MYQLLTYDYNFPLEISKMLKTYSKDFQTLKKIIFKRRMVKTILDYKGYMIITYCFEKFCTPFICLDFC